MLHTTLPVWVTKPNSETLTYKTVPKLISNLPLVITPNDVYVFDCGFFFTDKIASLNVVFS